MKIIRVKNKIKEVQSLHAKQFHIKKYLTEV